MMIVSTKQAFLLLYLHTLGAFNSLTIFVCLTFGVKSKETQMNETLRLVLYVAQRRFSRLTQCLFIVQSLVGNQ